jgi:hypothetical protein
METFYVLLSLADNTKHRCGIILGFYEKYIFSQDIREKIRILNIQS